MKLFEEAKMLYNQHREFISYEELRATGYTVLETTEILKYLSLLRVSCEYNNYLARVFDENCEVYHCYIFETNIARVKSIVEMRCEVYDIRYTDITIEKCP